MADSVGSGFPTSGINKGHTFYDLDEQSLWMYLGGIPRLSSSWILISGRLSVQPDTSLWGAAQAGAQWFLTSDLQFYGWNGSSIVLVSNGSSIPNLYDYKTQVRIQDDFLSGNAVDGSIGDLGWLQFGANNSVRPSDNVPTFRTGIYRLSTSSVSGTPALIALATDLLINLKLTVTVIWAVRLNTNDANVVLRIGLQNPSNSTSPTDGVYFEKLDADVNWFCVTRNSATQTRVDSTIAIDTLFHTFSWTRTASSVIFTIDGITVAENTTNIPTLTIVPTIYIINSAAANKSADIDYFQLSVTGLSR